MKQTVLLICLSIFSMIAISQPNANQWAWMRGDTTVFQFAVFGTMGVPADANKPGARLNASTWADASGNLWMFGGSGYDTITNGLLNDFWNYNRATNQWTWVGGSSVSNRPGAYGTIGVESSLNIPGSRYGATTWIDAAGTLWMFGGYGYGQNDRGYLNDLWKYNPSTNKWTWLKGDSVIDQAAVYGTKGVAAAANKPQGRYATVSWIDGLGRLWLFGGNGTPGNGNSSCNDLWMYDPGSNRWTWISGDPASPFGIYGTKGVASPANRPGARYGAAGWKDLSGNVWIYGGSGFASNSGAWLSDLWKFDPVSNQWTWVSGDNAPNELGVYGTKGTPAISNKPGARYYASSWTDNVGNLWMFGGNGYTSTRFAGGTLNDLWKFTPSTGQWTWVNGLDSADQPGVYGLKGVAESLNMPGTRLSSATWNDNAGNFWMLGGSTNYINAVGNLTDLWKYSTTGNQWTWVSGDDINRYTGNFGVMGQEDSANTPSARDHPVCWFDTSGNLLMFGGNGYTTSSHGSLNDFWKYNTVTNRWTWIGGSKTLGSNGVYGTIGQSSPTNFPGARDYAMTNADSRGNLWFFGGFGQGASQSGSLNDLWRYTTTTGQWTWVSGDTNPGRLGIYGSKGAPAAANNPGARTGGMTWSDAGGNFYLFGGAGYDQSSSGYLNDLWKFTALTGQWTWLGGDSTHDVRGNYGTQGITSVNNMPGARKDAVRWTDAAGNFWMFGGYGYGAYGYGYLDDLWKYDLSTGLWTWINGDSNTDHVGYYGTRGKPDQFNIPGGRYNAISWTDALGNFWLLGGLGYTSTAVGYLNDLWRYQPATGKWTWINGYNATYQPGKYGIPGMPDSTNTPGGRQYASGCSDALGKLWLFGGIGYSAYGFGAFNDIWRLETPLTALPIKLTAFTAHKDNQTAVLNWTTDFEQNSIAFTIERSATGTVFDSIGMVRASGNSSMAIKYSFIDITPEPGNNFYRLKQADADGNIFYTAIARVVMEEGVQLNIIQNPVKNLLLLNIHSPQSQRVTIQIRDMNGRLILSEVLNVQKGKSIHTLSTGNLNKGTYIINMQHTNLNIAKAFVKE